METVFEREGFKAETIAEKKTQRITRIADGVVVYERVGRPVDLKKQIDMLLECEERFRTEEVVFRGNEEW